MDMSTYHTEDDLALIHRLQSRVRVLSCLYDIATLLSRRELTQEAMAQALIDRLIVAYQFAASACARLTVFDRIYVTANFAESAWQQNADLTVNGVFVGVLTVGYLDERPPADEGPFLQEERDLIDQCVRQLDAALEGRRLQENLWHSDAMLRSMTEVADEIIFIVDRDLRILYINKVPEGITVESAIGRSANDFVAPAYRQRVYDTIQRVFATGRADAYEIEARGPNDGVVWYSTRLSPIWRGREVDRVLLLTEDISAQRAADLRLQESQGRYRALFEASTDAILLASSKGDIIDANPAACVLFGWTEEEIIHLNQNDLVDSAESLIQPMLERAVRTADFPSEITFVRKDGARFLGEIVATIFSDNDGRPSTSMMIRDITERRQSELALAASNARFHSLFQNMTLGVVYQGTDGRITLANAAAEHLLGLSLAQMQGRTSVDRRWRATREDGTDYPGDEHPAMVSLRTGKVVTDVVMGVYHAQRDEQRWIRIAAVPEFRPGETTPFRVFSTFDDITDRRRAEQALTDNEAHYRQAIQAAGAFAYSLDLTTGEYTFLSPEFEQLLGFVREATTTETFRSAIVTSIPRGQFNGLSYQEARSRARQGVGEPYWHCDHLLRSRTGEERWISDTAIQVLDDQGVPKASIGIIQDITERMATEAALRASEEKYRLLAAELEQRVLERTAEVQDLYDNAPCGYHTLDADGCFTMINQTELAWLGYTREELIGKSIRDYVTPASHAVIAEIYPCLMAQGLVTDLEIEFVCCDGSVLPVNLSATAIYGADGRLIASRGSVFDMTERKRAEDALRASETRLNFLLARTPAVIYSLAPTVEAPITFISDSVFDVMGYVPQLFAQNPGLWRQLAHPDDIGDSVDALPSLLEIGQALWEARVRMASGEYRWFSMGMSLVRDESASRRKSLVMRWTSTNRCRLKRRCASPKRASVR